MITLNIPKIPVELLYSFRWKSFQTNLFSGALATIQAPLNLYNFIFNYLKEPIAGATVLRQAQRQYFFLKSAMQIKT